MNKKKIIWGVVSLGIAVLTIRTLVVGNRSFSLRALLHSLEQADKGLIAAAVVCMFGFIWFEGYALVRIARVLGYRCTAGQGTVYGGADIFFSAITPSASGGQPASAWFMIRDGMSLAACVPALLINLVMYTLALMTVGTVCLASRPDLYMKMSLLSKILVGAGWFLLCGLTLIFYLLLRRAGLLHGAGNRIIRLLCRLRLTHHPERMEAWLDHKMEEFRECSDVIAGHGRMLAEVYGLNLLQRLCQLSVTALMFLAVGKGIGRSLEGFVIQSFVAMGANCIPVPGGMGGADYLMLDGFRIIVGEEAANMELLCRGLTFYLCVLTGAVIVIAGYVKVRKRQK